MRSLALEALALLCLCAQPAAARRVPPRWDSTTDAGAGINTGNGTDINIEDGEEYTRRRLAATADDHRVVDLPGLSEGSDLKHFAGHLPLRDPRAGALFYWLFEAPGDLAKTAPLLVWLNGGPGCSSMDGLFLELGPFKIVDGKLEENPYSWHKVSNLLIIDQPVGTGLSYSKGKYAANDKEVNQMFYEGMMEFFRIHPSFVSPSSGGQGGEGESRAMYLTGESHAGHYIPSMTAYINNANANSKSQSVRMNIAGIAIGNGWIDPFNQYDVSEFAHGQGFITKDQKNELKAKERMCQLSLSRKNFKDRNCFSLLDDVLDSTGGNRKYAMASMYDSRLFSKKRIFPPGKAAVETYLNQAGVRKALHVEPTAQRFAECTDPPYYALASQDGLGVVKEVQDILNSNIRVLMFSGQFDIIVNHLGTEKMLSQLQWSGSDGWATASNSVWSTDGQTPAGFVKSYKNLQFLIVLDAGHMVPLSKPRESLDMISRFLDNKPFADSVMKLPGRVAKKRVARQLGSEDAHYSSSIIPSSSCEMIDEINCEAKVEVLYSFGDSALSGMPDGHFEKLMASEVSLLLSAVPTVRFAGDRPRGHGRGGDAELLRGTVYFTGPSDAVSQVSFHFQTQLGSEQSSLRTGYLTRHLVTLHTNNSDNIEKEEEHFDAEVETKTATQPMFRQQ
jgi:carboxypeptidase D